MSTAAGQEEWMEQAACLGLDSDMFFPGPWEDPSPAKAVCAICPVREACLATALARREPDGIWGGLTATERRVDARRRRRRRRTARVA